MRNFWIILALALPLLGTLGTWGAKKLEPAERGPCQSFFSQKDKQLHMGAGFIIGLATNVILERANRPAPPSPRFLPPLNGTPSEMPNPTLYWSHERPGLTPWERALFSSMVAGLAGAAYEFVNRREARPDPNDILATFVGGATAGFFTLVIDF
jgi:hypothetical protein